MARGVINLLYGTVLTVCSLMLGAMAVVEYRAVILPSQLVHWALASLAGVLLCDQALQFYIRRRTSP